MKALVNGVIHTGRETYADRSLLIDGERIAGLPRPGDLPADAERIDLQGLHLAPGFVDLQLYGGGGWMFNDPASVDNLQRIANAHLQFGVTTFLPTIVTSTTERMRAARATVEAAIAAGNRSILGLHFEGPFLSVAKAGVHQTSLVRGLNDADAEIVSPGGLGRMMTIAPESFPAAAIERFRDAGVVLSIGHTNAIARDAARYFDAGVRCATHLHNAMSPFGSREPGVVGVVLADERVSAGIIVDGAHVDFLSVRATWNAFRSKSDGRLFLITDAMPCVGASVDHFTLDGRRIDVKDGVCRNEDGVLAGSALDMATAIRNCVRHVGVPLDEALRMASLYPAQVMGMDDRLGTLDPGRVADVAIFDDDMCVRGIAQNGVVTFF